MKIEKLEWKDEYSVGSEDIDDQHKKLLHIINEFSEHAMSDYQLAVMQLLNSLSNYTVYHFTYEEEMFEKMGYPLSSDHKRLHRTFINRLLDFRDLFEAGRDFHGEKIIQFLQNWIVHHICHHDKEMMSWVIEKRRAV